MAFKFKSLNAHIIMELNLIRPLQQSGSECKLGIPFCIFLVTLKDEWFENICLHPGYNLFSYFL